MVFGVERLPIFADGRLSFQHQCSGRCKAIRQREIAGWVPRYCTSFTLPSMNVTFTSL